jgi:hypothetical protein
MDKLYHISLVVRELEGVDPPYMNGELEEELRKIHNFLPGIEFIEVYVEELN